MKAIYAGSFSPPTLGHLDVIRRGAALFDELIVAVAGQSEKQYSFDLAARADMLRRVTADMPNVRVVSCTGLLVDLARREGADVLLRGLREASDLPFEQQLADANRMIGGFETLFITALPQYSRISSSIVRDCALHGAPIAGMVPAEILEDIYAVYGKGPHAERKC